MRAILSLVIGLVVGAVGATLYHQSLPPEPGTVAAKAAELEMELSRARIRIAALEDDRQGGSARNMEANLKSGARNIIDDLKEGRPVDVEDVFQTAKPALRILAPLLDRARRKALKEAIEGKVAELKARYHLNPLQEQTLRKWMETRMEQEAASFKNLALQENTSIEDLAKASRNIRPDEGLDGIMEQVLTGEDLTRYKTASMNEHAERVQSEADRKVTYLNDVVSLDAAQSDQIFAVMARSSREFDPSMRIDGLGTDTKPLVPGQSREDAILGILRPDQRQKYQDYRLQQRIEAEKKMNDIGLKLPANWDVFFEN